MAVENQCGVLIASFAPSLGMSCRNAFTPPPHWHQFAVLGLLINPKLPKLSQSFSEAWGRRLAQYADFVPRPRWVLRWNAYRHIYIYIYYIIYNYIYICIERERERERFHNYLDIRTVYIYMYIYICIYYNIEYIYIYIYIYIWLTKNVPKRKLRKPFQHHFASSGNRQCYLHREDPRKIHGRPPRKIWIASWENPPRKKNIAPRKIRGRSTWGLTRSWNITTH